MYQTIIRQICRCTETITTWGLRGTQFFMQNLMNIYSKVTQTTCSQVLEDKMNPQNMRRVLPETFGIHKHRTYIPHLADGVCFTRGSMALWVRIALDQACLNAHLTPSTSSCMILGRTSHASVCKMGVMVLPTPSAVLQIMWNDACQTHDTLPDTC